VLAVLGGSAAANPAGPRPEDKAEADRLFEEGRQLVAKGDRAGGCKLFDQSIAKDPRAVGTMLNVGLCREEGGAIASAMRVYAEARDRARDQSLAEHREAAERKLAMLAPRVPHLAISLPGDAPAQTRVLVDDLVLARDQLDDVLVDPGHHNVVVTAPGKLAFETAVDIKESEHRQVRVPALEGKTIIVEPDSRRAYGKLGVGVGAALGVFALGLGFYARAQYWDQFPAASRDGKDAADPQHHCFTLDGTRHCDPEGASKTHTAHVVANVATGTGIVSALVIGAGVYLWLTGPKGVQVDVGGDHAGVTATVRF
jgi:hypothetical protein